jgi:putative DNA primase/helicase
MTENSIEPTLASQPEAGNAAQKPTQATQTTDPLKGATDAKVNAAPTQGAQVQPDDALVATMAKLKLQYLLDKDKYYFRDDTKVVAFEETGLPLFRRLVTKHDNAEIARSMVELAKAKGWSSIKVDGSDSFKQKVWIEAQLQGLSVTGFKPDAFDQDALQKRQAVAASDVRQPPTTPNSIAPSDLRPAPDAPEREAAATSKPKARPTATKFSKALAMALPQAGIAKDSQEFAAVMDYVRDLASSPRAYVGKLIDHGTARYQFKEKGAPSYYIKLDTDAGEKTVWGVDLQRAAFESPGGGLNKGDAVVMAFRGAQPVSVVDSETGSKAEFQRNTWFVAKVSDLLALASKAEVRPEVDTGATTPTQSPPAIATTVPGAAPLTEREKVLIDVLQAKGAPAEMINAVRVRVAETLANPIASPTPAGIPTRPLAPSLRPDYSVPTPSPTPAL